MTTQGPAMATPDTETLLRALEGKMASYNLRGQWMADQRPQVIRKGANDQRIAEPIPSGVPHVWRWTNMLPLLHEAREAMRKSSTARRALIFTNPGLPRGTTQTMLATFQIVPAGETAWAHRHSIHALRFAVQGSEKVFTVVDGRPLMMEPYDLVLTPGWTWHDHHNESDEDAIWMDGLDVPFALGINQGFQEDFGEEMQPRTADDAAYSGMLRPRGVADPNARPYRYPWKDTLRVLDAQKNDPADPYRGRVLEYVNPLTGGAPLPTIACAIQVLPPGFEGRTFRRTASSIAMCIEGEGRTIFKDREIDWSKHDALALPNWTWHRHVNRSKRDPVILFTMSDTPILSAFGYYREETEDREALAPSAPAARLSAAE